MRYRLDPRQGRFHVQAFATGMLSLLAHSPRFSVGDFHGQIVLDEGAPGFMTLHVVVAADSLILTDRVSASDRREIEERMHREVLETAKYPEICLETQEVWATPIEPGRYRLRLNGRLSLHGVTCPEMLDAEMRVSAERVEIFGECPLRMSDFRITSVTALGGTIRLKDELSVSFALVGLAEQP